MRLLTAITCSFTASLTIALAACSPQEAPQKKNEQALHVAIGASPQSIDPHVATGSPGLKVLDALCEGLVNINMQTYEVEPAIATSWEISEDGKRYTFSLRDDARWSNGDAVTAEDFAYTWKRSLLPAVGWQYAPDFYAIQGAAEYNKGEHSDFSKVGVKALDAHTLQFTLKQPDALLLKQLGQEITCPVSKKAVEAHGAIDDVSSRWTDAGNYITNGPFVLREWEINQVIVAEKSPHYWDAANVKLEKIYFYPIDTESGEERAFRSGQVQLTLSGVVPAEKIAKYREGEPEKITTVEAYGTYFYLFNVTKAPFDNPLVRNALSLVVNRQSIVDNITKAGQIPASTLSLMTESYHPDFNNEIYNPDKARQLLAEAGYPGGKGFPTFTVIYNTADAHRKIALAIQQMWKTELGIDAQIENQEWKTFLSTRQDLHFDISRAGSISTLADPQDFLNSYTTGHGMNDTGWSNAEFDALLETAKVETGDERYTLLAEAEAVLLRELPLIPIYYYSFTYLKDPSVKGAEFNAIGRLNYKDIYIDHSEKK